jgi:predicted dehydrogenase
VSVGVAPPGLSGATGPPIRCAIVGVGMMGREHAAILAASSAAELVVACDIDPDAAGRLPAGVRLVGDLETTLETPGLEAVVIATPPEHHRAAVDAAIRRGLAVFCEKPIAGSLEDADALVIAGSRPGVRLVIGHMLRFDPRYRAIAEAVHAGRLGRPIQLTMRGNVPDFEGRALAGRVSLAVENLVHAFDLWSWMVGPIVRVHGEASATEALGPGIVDSIVVTVRFASGAVGTLASAWNMPSSLGYASESFFSLLGSEGLAWVDGRDSGTGIVGPGLTSFPSTLSWPDPSGVPYGLYRAELEHFLAGVRDHRPWPVSLAEARAAVAVALAVDESIATGQPVELAA